MVVFVHYNNFGSEKSFVSADRDILTNFVALIASLQRALRNSVQTTTSFTCTHIESMQVVVSINSVCLFYNYRLISVHDERSAN